MYPEKYRYTKEHEWIDASGKKTARVGITDHAQSELGDIVAVQLPEVGAEYAGGAEFGVVDSVKAASPVYMPVAAKVVRVNQTLLDKPELVNQDPHGEGWFCEVELVDKGALAGLLSAGDYQVLLKG
jgi:glycine cleavage system H protein